MGNETQVWICLMSGLCFFPTAYPLSLHIISSLGISASPRPSSIWAPPPCTQPLSGFSELLESRQAQSCPQGICPCCSPHSSEIAVGFSISIFRSLCKRALLRRPSYPILFKTANHPRIPISSLFFSLCTFNIAPPPAPPPTLFWFIVYSVPRAGP